MARHILSLGRVEKRKGVEPLRVSRAAIRHPRVHETHGELSGGTSSSRLEQTSESPRSHALSGFFYAPAYLLGGTASISSASALLKLLLPSSAPL